MAFEKIFLLSGEGRAEYIQKRLADGADAPAILAEINGPLLFSGTAGKPWLATVIYAVQRTMREAADGKVKRAPGRPAMKRIDPLIGEAHVPRAAVAPIASFDPVDDDDAGDPGSESVEVPPEYEGILDAEDMVEIRKEAAEAIRKEQRKKARAEALTQAKEALAREAREARQSSPARGDMRDVYIDLPPFGHKDGSDIRLDGQVFGHGRTYRVTVHVARTLADQMEMSWKAHKSTTGERQDFNRKRNIEVSAKRGVIGAEGLQA